MNCNAVSEAMQKLVDGGLASPPSFQGCTGQQISLIEKRFGLLLPSCYKDFLSAMGHNAGEFLVGTDYSYPKMLEFRKEADELLRTCKSEFTLPPSAFVFMFSQGYTFVFFDCNHDFHDPSVFMFTETDTEPDKIANSFSEWLIRAVDGDIEIYKSLNH